MFAVNTTTLTHTFICNKWRSKLTSHPLTYSGEAGHSATRGGVGSAHDSAALCGGPDADAREGRVCVLQGLGVCVGLSPSESCFVMCILFVIDVVCMVVNIC